MQQVITGSVSVPANSTIANVLSGSRIEDLPGNSQTTSAVTIATTGSATGLINAAFVGQQGNPVEDSIVSAQNRVPIIRDDLVVKFLARGAQKMQLRVQNTTGGALTFFYTVMVEGA